MARSPQSERRTFGCTRSVLIQGATVWTCGPEGRLENADVLVVDGKIKGVGRQLAPPKDDSQPPVVIDGTGLHVTPGLIDCHSHSAILGAVNESTLPSTAMVRIHDVVNSESEDLYEQLAGGVTSANLLHGSANPIGGQNCVIKLRDGAGPEDLVFAAAPAGIKFALGENVKQSNWGDKFSSRFPQTRMGVENIHRESLHCRAGIPGRAPRQRKWRRGSETRATAQPRTGSDRRNSRGSPVDPLPCISAG